MSHLINALVRSWSTLKSPRRAAPVDMPEIRKRGPKTPECHADRATMPLKKIPV